LEDGDRTLPADVRIDSRLGKGAWVRIIMREGRKRQIREIGKRIGLPVVRILRVRIGTLKLGDLKPREWRNLTVEEVNTLRSLQEQSTSRKNHLPGRQMDENSERKPERKRRPFSPHKPSAIGVRKPGTAIRRRVEPSSGLPYSAKKNETGLNWKSKPTTSGTGKYEKKDSQPSRDGERRLTKTGWKPGANSGRKPGTGPSRRPSSQTGSKPPTRSPRKPERKS